MSTEYEGYPGIAHDLEAMRTQCAELVEALRNIAADAERGLETRTIADMDFALVHVQDAARAILAKIDQQL